MIRPMLQCGMTLAPAADGSKSAAQLVRAGKLAEASAALQRTLLDGGLRQPRAAPSPAPEADARTERGRFSSHRYGNAAGTRTYKVYTPTQFLARHMPVVVMLHGCTQDPDDFAAGTRMNRLAEELGTRSATRASRR